MDWRRLTVWTLQVVAAAILLQTLRFKFTGAPIAVDIFTRLGVEPWGRILTGVLELITGLLLLLPWTAVYGALLAAAIMLGAIASHVFVLGIVVEGDGGSLFVLTLIVLVFSAAIIGMRREELRFPWSR
ncbi:DoxX family protein [Candidatus Woesearchaeota archaeon]|nr:MAG: DoxX family protein [Candidatus Woesearchaeota archaeon]